MNRNKIKEEASKLALDNMWTILTPLLIVIILTSIGSFVGGLIFGYDSYKGTLASIGVALIISPMNIGVKKFMLDIIRKDTPSLYSLTDYYNKIINIVLLSIAMGVLIGVGSILIVPGVIFFLYFAMSEYLLVDNENLPFHICMKRSKKMMDGYKKDYLLFLLSFIGWVLLCLLIIPMVFVLPYISIANALYYENLKKINEQKALEEKNMPILN